MADLDNATKLKLESIFGMSGGYVLNFSNARFADFVRTVIGVSPYQKYGEASKAVVLRAVWEGEPANVVAKLNLDLLEHWRVSKLVAGIEPTRTELMLHDELEAQFEPLVTTLSASDTAFLAKDFGDVSLAQLPTALTAQNVIESRLAEIDACIEAKAPPAVIFLVGSTLEGLLMELALAQASTFVGAQAAPKMRDQTVKPIDSWRLAELIAVSRELGVIGADVSEHADQVRNFRNYIHPRQQLREKFEPRMETALIAQQVLRAALVDLSKLT